MVKRNSLNQQPAAGWGLETGLSKVKVETNWENTSEVK